MPSSSTFSVTLLCALTAWSGPAAAGGIGLVGTTGFHSARLYYYDADGKQYLNSQVLPNNGGGLELVLGDKDDKLLGVARGFYLLDASVHDPADPLVADPIYVLPEGPMHLGVATVGLHWGVLGDPTAFQAHLAAHVGAGVLTVDSGTGEGANLEFLLGEIGAGVQYHFEKNVQIYADVAFAARFRKDISLGGTGYLGVRYMFD